MRTILERFLYAHKTGRACPKPFIDYLRQSLTLLCTLADVHEQAFVKIAGPGADGLVELFGRYLPLGNRSLHLRAVSPTEFFDRPRLLIAEKRISRGIVGWLRYRYLPD